MKKIVIAIDGYSSCGKSTMAKELAHRLGYVYVDTGAMYRSVTLFALREHLFDAEDTLDADRCCPRYASTSASTPRRAMPTPASMERTWNRRSVASKCRAV